MKHNKGISFTMMVGLPRSGKSTWAKKYARDAVIVSPDEIRMDIFGHEFHKPAEDFIWAVAKAMTRLMLKQGKSVVLDATNLYHATRLPWIRLAREFGASTSIVHFATSLEECLRRNAKCSRKVPEGVLQDMSLVMEGVLGDEADQVISINEHSDKKTKGKRRHE